MTTFVPSAGLKVCPPLEAWRPDDLTLWPHCVGAHCGKQIRKGQLYAVAVVGNAVFCRSCAESLGVQIKK